jgi:hypothetical protein
MLAEQGAERALVFANHLVAPERQASWAYTPPNPKPDLSDDILFVRRPEGPGGPLISHQFWRRRFPERRAFIYFDGRAGNVLVELHADQRPAPGDDLGQLIQAAPPVPQSPVPQSRAGGPS